MGLVGFAGVVGWGYTGKAGMPSGRLAFATRRVDLMAADMRATLALCVGGRPFSPPPTSVGKKFDQMPVVVRVQGAPGFQFFVYKLQ